MNSTFVSSARPDLNIRFNHNYLYQFPDSDGYGSNPTLDDGVQPIGWDCRYGIMFFSEKALIYGPFLIPSSSEHYILSQMPKFLRETGKKCLYHIFEAYTAIEMDESGLIARSRDHTTDQVFYFPSQYPNYIVLSVVYFKGDNFSKCAVWVYEFQSAETASQAFKMLMKTKGVPQKRRSSKATGMGITSRVTLTPNRSPSNYISKHRSSSTKALKDRDVQSRFRTRQIDIHSPIQPQWDESFNSFGQQKVTIPVKFNRNGSKQRSDSHKNRRLNQRTSAMTSQNLCYNHCGRKSPGKNLKTTHKGASASDGNGITVILNGKKYPWNMFRSVIQLGDIKTAVYQLSKVKTPTHSGKDSSTISEIISESSGLVTNTATGNGSVESSSGSSNSIVKLVWDNSRKSPKVAGSETAFNNRNVSRSDEGRNSSLVIRVSRQEFSDSEADLIGDNLRSNGFERLASPTRVIGDGTTVYNLYRRQKLAGSGTVLTQAEA